MLISINIAVLLAIPISAAVKDISANFRKIKININGKMAKTEKKPFIYNESTYVPLRFISESMGAKVEWDDKTNIISIHQEGNTTITEAINSLKSFTGTSENNIQFLETVPINGILHYKMKWTSIDSTNQEEIYYNLSDKLLYIVFENAMKVFQ